MSLFQSPFNLSDGDWTNGPDLNTNGKMSYPWARIVYNSSLYYGVTAEGPSYCEITVIDGRLVRYHASSDSSNITLSGHSFYTTFQTRGCSVDEAVAANGTSGPKHYYPYGIREGVYGPSTGNDNSRLIIFGVAT